MFQLNMGNILRRVATLLIGMFRTEQVKMLDIESDPGSETDPGRLNWWPKLLMK